MIVASFSSRLVRFLSEFLPLAAAMARRYRSLARATNSDARLWHRLRGERQGGKRKNRTGSVARLARRSRKPRDARVIVAHLHVLFASYDLVRVTARSRDQRLRC